MFCPKCGKHQPDEAFFCDGCGERLAQAPIARSGAEEPPVDDAARFSSDGEGRLSSDEAAYPSFEGEERSSSDDAVPDAAPDAAPVAKNTARFAKRIAMVVVAALAIAALAAVAFVVSMPPDLSDDSILEDLDADALAASTEIASEWADGGEFSVASTSVDSVEDAGGQQAPASKIALVTVVCESATFRVTSTYQLAYGLQDKEWVLDDALQLNQGVEPLGGVSDEAVISQVPTFLAMVDDESPLKDSDGKKQYLEDRYVENVKFEVVENGTSGQGGSVKVSLSAQRGFAAYSGMLTVDFSWNGSDWEVSGCAVDEAAYQANYDSLLGTWSGTRHDGNAAVGQECLAGKTTPFRLSVKDIDADSLVMKVDMEFVGHKHKWLDNIVESSEGDEVIGLSDVLIPLPEDVGEGVVAYEAEANQNPRWKYTIFFTANEDQTIEVMVAYVWEHDTHYDFYTLEKEQ